MWICHLYLVSSIWFCGAIPPLLLMPRDHVMGRFYVFFFTVAFNPSRISNLQPTLNTRETFICYKCTAVTSCCRLILLWYKTDRELYEFHKFCVDVTTMHSLVPLCPSSSSRLHYTQRTTRRRRQRIPFLSYSPLSISYFYLLPAFLPFRSNAVLQFLEHYSSWLVTIYTFRSLHSAVKSPYYFLCIFARARHFKSR